jgi:uncharacterized iron-regulated membrane protein
MTANRFVYGIHKWMGIVAGAILVVIGLTGSVIVFDDELDRWLNPRLLQVQPGERVEPVDTQVAAAARTFSQGKLDGVFLPVHERAVTEVYFETADHEHWMISVNPYTAERAMLDLTPEERLRKVEDFARGLAEIRDRDAGRPLR